MGCLLIAAAIILAILSHPLPAQLPDVTSSTVTIHWQSVRGATQIRVYLMADPEAVKMLLATLPGDATSYTATNLAPAVSLFLDMEADTGDGNSPEAAYR